MCHILCQAQLEMRKIQGLPPGTQMSHSIWHARQGCSLGLDFVDTCHWWERSAPLIHRPESCRVRQPCLPPSPTPHTHPSVTLQGSCHLCLYQREPQRVRPAALAPRAPGSPAPGRHWQPSPLPGQGCEDTSGHMRTLAGAANSSSGTSTERETWQHLLLVSPACS